MLHIKFIYKDNFSHGDWICRHCVVPSVEECIKMYGLNEPDVEYEILSIVKVDDDNE